MNDKRTPWEWERFFDIHILGFEGWKLARMSVNQPISRHVFKGLLQKSTMSREDWARFNSQMSALDTSDRNDLCTDPRLVPRTIFKTNKIPRTDFTTRHEYAVSVFKMTEELLPAVSFLLGKPFQEVELIYWRALGQGKTVELRLDLHNPANNEMRVIDA